MSKTTEISAAQWLAVRESVVTSLGLASPRSEKDTRVRMAEQPISSGYVDVEFIAAEIVVAERKAAERLARTAKPVPAAAKS